MKTNLNDFSTLLFLNGNKTNQSYFAVGAKKELLIEKGDPFNPLDEFLADQNTWKFGYLSYDLKNDIEKLTSANFDGLKFPKLYFFVPLNLYEIKDEFISIIYGDPDLIPAIKEFIENKKETKKVSLKQRISQQDYLDSIKNIKDHIQLGDTYELNFCHEFYNEQAEIDPQSVFAKLTAATQAPFSCFGKFNDRYILSASPERFLQKEDNKIISQPIKGTAPRGKNDQEDLLLTSELENSEKERSENIMIVDLVRNDFSRFALKNSVKVDELCKIYSFETVHQMISTISCLVDKNVKFTDILKATFPMGSMTGAPKIRSMELIEQFESTKRGIYSGSVGYIAPNGNFDFNVIIRTLLYNEANKYLSCMVGGAITAKSDPQKEFEETLLKADAILKALR